MDGKINRATTAKDPVCNMDVDPSTARFSVSYGEEDYYFCCGGCADKFKAQPEKYLNKTTFVSVGMVSSNLVTLGARLPRASKNQLPL
jgi:YHS domain-containing protein